MRDKKSEKIQSKFKRKPIRSSNVVEIVRSLEGQKCEKSGKKGKRNI